MTEPNLPVELMFKQVRLAVEQETKGQQIPWELSSLRENFAFNPGTGGPTSTPVVSTPTVVTPPSPQPSTSGGTQVAVGVYPQAPAAPKTQRNSLGMEFVLIPAGTFQMGSNDSDAYGDEKPVHTVRLTQPFYLGKYEVTQGQWQAVMGNNPSGFTGDPNRPVEQVSRGDVLAIRDHFFIRNDVPYLAMIVTYTLPHLTSPAAPAAPAHQQEPSWRSLVTSEEVPLFNTLPRLAARTQQAGGRATVCSLYQQDARRHCQGAAAESDAARQHRALRQSQTGKIRSGTAGHLDHGQPPSAHHSSSHTQRVC